jgi:gentisate 1,2-dioxygenase
MDYKLFKNALTASECADFVVFGKSQYSLLKEDQLYPNRGYPGFTLQNAKSVLEKLATFITQAEFNDSYDYSFGTGVNFINAQEGELIGQHIDKPLYELDDNYKVKSEFENRYCAVTVIACIGGKNNLVVDDDNIEVSTGDVVVMKGFTVHEMKPIVSDTFYLLSAFYCTDLG